MDTNTLTEHNHTDAARNDKLVYNQFY